MPPRLRVPRASLAVLMVLLAVGIADDVVVAVDAIRPFLLGSFKRVVIVAEALTLVRWMAWLAWLVAVARALRGAGARDVPSGAWIVGSYLIPVVSAVTHYLVLWRLWIAASALSGRRSGEGRAMDLALPLWWFGGLIVGLFYAFTAPFLVLALGGHVPRAFDPAYTSSRGAVMAVRLLAAAWGAGTIGIVVAFTSCVRRARELAQRAGSSGQGSPLASAPPREHGAVAPGR